MLDDSVLKVCLDYYTRKTGRAPTASEREIIENMLRRGMNGGRIMDCVDAAVSSCGLTAYGQDYWKTNH